ncbi:micrococcal nuclease [Malassezia obtusa]|uniref:Micrococcal nuclease n=1 Tax=Malassezia obtusa TaxID=76774 RepID=A0AAF0E2I6_9BASI|nr:micrococcal nuclease [Malassezia obtusa]
MADAADAYYGDLARWVRAHEAQLYQRPRGARLATDLHHLFYFLLRCEALGLDVGDMDRAVGAPLVLPTGARAPPARPRTLADDLQSIFSVQDTIHTVQTLWGTRPAQTDPDDKFRFLFRVCSRLPALDVYALPDAVLEGFDDLPGENGVPLRAFAALRDLRLHDVEAGRVLGWDRLSVQLEALQCARVSAADVTELFVGLVARDAGDAPPAAAWHALRSLNLARNALTFVPATALAPLTALVHLDLSHNLLNTVPPALAELPHLRALNLADNLIDSVLGIYDALPAVRSLNLAANRLESLCGLERLTTLEQVDLRSNALAEPGEVGRLATLPRISHVWIADNPMGTLVPDVRVACFTLFALEHKDIALDDAPAGFFERRRVAERVARQVAPATHRPDTAIEAQLSSRVRRVTLAPSTPPHDERRRRPRRTDPGPLGARTERPRRPRRSEAPALAAVRAEAAEDARAPPSGEPSAGGSAGPSAAPRTLKERIEQLRGDAGDDWLRQFARHQYKGTPREERTYPVHAVDEAAPAAQFSTPFRLALGAVSTPVGAALVTGAALVGGRVLYLRYFRRFATAADLTPSVLRTRRTLVGKVTSVGDADGFRFYHTPGLPFVRHYLFPVPASKAALRNQTISVRLAGADAPEAAHFGREAQPFADEAKAELKRLVDGQTVWLDLAHIDQYQRLVATPYVLRPPYIFGRTNVSLAMVRKGLATVYRNAGAAYGHPGFWQRTLLHATSGRRSLERAEEYAKLMRLGMWSRGRDVETPGAFKRRMRE